MYLQPATYINKNLLDEIRCRFFCTEIFLGGYGSYTTNLHLVVFGTVFFSYLLKILGGYGKHAQRFSFQKCGTLKIKVKFAYLWITFFKQTKVIVTCSIITDVFC